MVFMQDNTPRRIWMDGRSPPAEQPPTSMGFSTGQWEGRTLVIETTMLLPGWLDGSGYPMSGGADTRIVERWTPAADGLTMERLMTVHDKLYTAPIVRTRGSQRGDATLGLIESEPCDARPFYNELLERGELEERLRPSSSGAWRQIYFLPMTADVSTHRPYRQKIDLSPFQSYSVYLRESPRTRSAGYLRSLSAILSSAARSRSTSSRSAKRKQIDEHVRELEPHALAALGIERAALLLRQPLKLLDELGRLDGQRHREVLRRMELLPIARGRERGEPLLQRA